MSYSITYYNNFPRPVPHELTRRLKTHLVLGIPLRADDWAVLAQVLLGIAVF